MQDQTATLPSRVPPLPGWVNSAPAADLTDAAFLAGGALAHLHLAAAQPDLPAAVWRDRLALAAAELCTGLAGRREGQAALRDAVALTGPGDDPGPAGRVLRAWQRAVARPITVAHLAQVLPGLAEDQIAAALGTGQGTPVDRAAAVLEALLTQNPRGEMGALILADAALARAVGSAHLVPLLSLGLKAADLRRRGSDLRLVCHRAVVPAVRQAQAQAADLQRAAHRLREVAPRLRAKGAGRALDLFLTHDALTPATLSRELRTGLSDRAARRLCDRLVALGAVRELTGRDTFRLYGL